MLITASASSGLVGHLWGASYTAHPKTPSDGAQLPCGSSSIKARFIGFTHPLAPFLCFPGSPFHRLIAPKSLSPPSDFRKSKPKQALCHLFSMNLDSFRHAHRLPMHPLFLSFNGQLALLALSG